MLVLVAFAGAGVRAQSDSATEQFASGLPEELATLLTADPLPMPVLDPQRRYLLLVHEHQLLARSQLTSPVVELAGRQVNPRTVAAHAPRDYYGFTLVDLGNGAEVPIPIPRGSTVGYPEWSPDGSRFAFTLINPFGGTELWIGEPQEGRARPLLGRLNATLGSPCGWTGDSRRLLCRLVTAKGRHRQSYPEDPLVGLPAAIQMLIGRPPLSDAGLAQGLLESQLVIVDAVSGQRHEVGAAAAFEAAVMAPSQAFILITRIAAPYPSVGGIDSLHRVVEVWDRTGKFIARLSPSARAVGWHATEPATVIWAERRDGRDRVMSWAPPFAGSPEPVHELEHRLSGLRWLGNSGAALVGDYDADSQMTDFWFIEPSGQGASRRVMTVPAADGRTPLMTTNRHGVEAVALYDDGYFLRGRETSDDSTLPVLDYVPLDGRPIQRIWKAADTDGETESLVDILSADGGALLTRRETDVASPNYFISIRGAGRDIALTAYEHPATAFADVTRERLTYRRDDGLALGATLYLPPGYDRSEPLPMIVWAYPRQVVPGGATSVAPERTRFSAHDRIFRLFYLLRGYAVLDDVSMPIVGSPQDANDTFIEQIVANARAGVTAAIRTGFIDGDRVAVAGHSYGAFMVANLLAHSHIFSAGAALSGAYNRTLTPFGFQTERRTLWQAQQTYLAMSPLLYSNRIDVPLLLVHGLNDDNASTSPLQSAQFYEAITGNAGDAKLLLLPGEGHVYRSSEGVLATAAEMLAWFDRYVRR